MIKRFVIVIFGVLLALISGFWFFSITHAAPAAPVDHVLTQPDGSTFVAQQWGDEWSNGFETIDGHTIFLENSEWWVYAQKKPDGSLAPALYREESLKVGISDPEGIPLYIRPDLAEPDRLLTAFPTSEISNIGDQPVLILLAQFNDRMGTYPASDWASMMFGASNSVRDFYSQASFNLLDFTPANETHGSSNDGVVGWLTLNYDHPNTGSSTNIDNQNIVRDVLIAANPFVDFSSFDTNGDGYISTDELHIVVVVAGYEAATTTAEPSIWAHRWSLANPVTLDGVILGDFSNSGGYSQIGEIQLLNGIENHATIGIVAHELGHDIGWPDLYDISGQSAGVGNWSIMSGGSWNRTGTNRQGSSPALPDAWLKYYQGWINPTAVNGSLIGASIPRASDNPTVFRLRPNPGGVNWKFFEHSGTGEYFLVENRQLHSYDAGLPGSGLLIWHIDESVTSSNFANGNRDHPLVKLIEADGENHLYYNNNRGDTGDPFPGSTNNRTFDKDSYPNSLLYNGHESFVSVSNISNSATTMTADLTFDAPLVNNLVYLPLVVNNWDPSVFNIKPRITAPADGAFVDTLIPQLTWQTNPNLHPWSWLGYWISTTPSFDNWRFGWELASTGSTILKENLEENTTYYWYAAYDYYDEATGWWEWGPTTAMFSFTTGGGYTVPGTPSLLSPENDAYITTLPFTLHWSPVAGAAEYQIRLWTEYEWNGNYYWYYNLFYSTSSNFEIYEWILQSNTNYKWEVRARNEQAWGQWSPYMTFTTGAISSSSAPAETLSRESLFIQGEGGEVIPMKEYSSDQFQGGRLIPEPPLNE